MKTTKAVRRPTAAVTVKTPVPSQGPQLWHYAVGAAIAAFIVFLVYGPALHGPFFFDDTYLPYALPSYAASGLRSWLAGVRPILMLSFWLNFQQSGMETYSYHLANVLIHLINGCLVFFVVRKVLELARFDKTQVLIFSIFSAGLFLLHPVQTESVSYIASRSETLSICFFLAAFVAFLYRPKAAAPWWTALLVMLLFAAACLTKEHSAVLPVLLLLTDYYWNPGFNFEGVKRNWKVYIPIAVGAVAAGVFVLSILRKSGSAGFGLQDFTWYQYFFTECRAFWRYLLLFVLPFGQNIDHDFPVSKTLLDHGAILGLIGLIALIAAAWIYRRRFPLISYGVFVTLLLFAPTSSFLPIRDTFVEHRMYLPFIGLLFITCGALQLWKAKPTTLVTTLGVVLLAMSWLSYSRNQLWGNLVAMWADSVSKAPAKYRPHFQLAYAYYQNNQCQQAADEFAKTAAMEPPDYTLDIDWALAEDCAGNETGALDKLKKSLALSPSAHVYSQIGMVYAKMKQYPQALDALDKAAKIDPNFEMTYVYRGNIYFLQGDRQQAAANYQRALEIDPQNQTARQGLMNLSKR